MPSFLFFKLLNLEHLEYTRKICTFKKTDLLIKAFFLKLKTHENDTICHGALIYNYRIRYDNNTHTQKVLDRLQYFGS